MDDKLNRFYRVDKSRSRISDGAGVAITIIKSIVMAHKENIAVGNKLNEGTKFIIIIPKTNE